ncbi:MAG: hypothetical protein QHH24_00335 [Candidatus Bathyarchaeota archaeon]|nr:hypothetical protein [Candidatus Bathyarchaeota archaeon]
MTVGSDDDLKRLLKEKGYSDNAVWEIMKWYNPDGEKDSQKRCTCTRDSRR